MCLQKLHHCTNRAVNWVMMINLHFWVYNLLMEGALVFNIVCTTSVERPAGLPQGPDPGAPNVVVGVGNCPLCMREKIPPNRNLPRCTIQEGTRVYRLRCTNKEPLATGGLSHGAPWLGLPEAEL